VSDTLKPTVQTIERTYAAAKTGADVVLLERYNHLGGLSTGGPEVRNP
jgi:hypothetical protein